MKKSQIAAQLYSIRDYTQTLSDIPASLKRIKDIGYDAVQLSGLGPVDENELVKMLDGEGLVCCATHEPGEQIIENPNAVVDRLNKLNCRLTAFPHPGKYPVNTMEAVLKLAADLDKSGKVLHENGLVLGYHNHNIEFIKYEGKTVLEWIYEKTDPENLVGEIDTYWIQAGGGDPTDWIRLLAGRLPFIHLKDFGFDIDKGICFKEIGFGNLKWKEIIDESEKSGCEWFIIEQDSNWENNDPFLSLKMSLDYLAENICE